MTIAHLSDTHLGFRAYGRSTPAGLNQREADVMDTFERTLEAILAYDPDLVVHAGDLFHLVRPGNATLVRTFQALSSFQSRRKGKPFVLIGGNHDTPRSSDSGNILRLFESIPGLYLVPNQTQILDFPDLDLEVLAVPSYARTHGPPTDYLPSLGRRYAVLTLHGMARQALPRHAQFDVSQTRHEAWTYVALGDYHGFQSYGANVCYSGSTDFASTNIWDEIRTPKAWVWFDSAVGVLQPIPIETRTVLDLEPIDAAGLDLQTIHDLLRDRAKWEASQPIVRQRVLNFPPSLRGKLDPSIVRELTSRALNYQLQLLAPQVVSGTTRETPGLTLEQRWSERTTKTPHLRDLGLALLKEVASVEAAPDPA